MIASRRFPATWHEYDALCFTKIKLFLRFIHEWPICGAVWGTRRATKATQNVRYFSQEVSCGTNEAFAQNSTRDCRPTCHMQADHARPRLFSRGTHKVRGDHQLSHCVG